MGSFLDKPITEKETHSGSGNELLFGLSAMQGWRVEMEDAHTAEVDIPALPGSSFFAVYDGHGGSTISTHSCTKLLPKIFETTAFAATEKTAEVLSDALHQGLLDLDAELRKMPCFEAGTDRSGSTAITGLVSPTHVILGNCGDSRAVLASDGAVKFATEDHKPMNEVEQKRIRKAGGFLEMGRVCGNLAVSRALGDYAYKDRGDLPAEEQKISCDADMTIIPREEKDEFLILACDGIWDVMYSRDAVRFVTEQLKAGVKAPAICEALLDTCLQLGSKDNMSVVLVLFPNAPKAVEGYTPPAFVPELTPTAPGPPLGMMGGGAGGGSDEDRLSQLSSLLTGEQLAELLIAASGEGEGEGEGEDEGEGDDEGQAAEDS